MRARIATVVVAGALLVTCRRAAGEPEPLATSRAHEVVGVAPPADPVRGPRFAPVTIDLWVTVGHAGSRAAWERVRRAVEHDPSVRAVVHLVPTVTGMSPLVVEAALEAERLGALFPFADRLFDAQLAAPTLADLAQIGAEVGLDPDELERALSDRVHRARADQLRLRAQGHFIGELWINAERVYVGSDAMLGERIRAARGRAETLLDSGVPLGKLYDAFVAEKERRGPTATELPAWRRAPTAPPRSPVLRPSGPGLSGPSGPPRPAPVDLTGAPSRGPSFAPITLTVFGNLSCASCAELAQLVRHARALHPSAIREVWKNWTPAYGMPGPEPFAAELAVGAALQGRFWELYELALPASASYSARRTPLTAPELERLALTAGVSLTRLTDDRQRDRLRPQLERDRGDSRRIGLIYTPNVMVNGVLLNPPLNAERLEQLIADELGRSLLERATAN